jgi:hypothetical protein
MLFKRGRRYWTDFTLDGVRYRKPLGTTDGRVAKQRERSLIEEAGAGKVNSREKGPRKLYDAIQAYLEVKRVRCSERTLELESERLSVVKKHLGDIRLSAVTATRIAEYQANRHDAGIANRTINMDVAVLLRVLKAAGRSRAVVDNVKLLPERPSLIGRALTAVEQKRLLDVAASNPEWEHVYCAAALAANTSLRPVEVKHLRRGDVDLFKKTLTVRRSKNVSSHRRHPPQSDGHQGPVPYVGTG